MARARRFRKRKRKDHLVRNIIIIIALTAAIAWAIAYSATIIDVVYCTNAWVQLHGLHASSVECAGGWSSCNSISDSNAATYGDCRFSFSDCYYYANYTTNATILDATFYYKQLVFGTQAIPLRDYCFMEVANSSVIALRIVADQETQVSTLYCYDDNGEWHSIGSSAETTFMDIWLDTRIYYQVCEGRVKH